MFELRSYKKPLVRGHTPLVLEPANKIVQQQQEVGTYYDARGKIYEPYDQEVAGDVTPVTKEQVIPEATRLFSNPECWHITINEYIKDENGKELRSPVHWCANVKQVQDYLNA